MGKTKPRKRSAIRNRPLGVPKLEEAPAKSSDHDDEKPSSQVLIPLLEKLNSPSHADRECACASLANLVLDADAIPVLVRQGLVRRLGPLLLDDVRSIQEAAAGSLRNLSLSGGPDICVTMVEQDVMTPLMVLIHKTLATLAGGEKSSDACNLAVQTVSLLWNLCECSSTAVEIFNKENLLPMLVSCLNVEVFPTSVAVPAAQCLHTVTEDNQTAAQCLCESTSLMKLLESSMMAEQSSGDMLLTKVLSAGILYNVRHSIPVCYINELIQAVVKVLHQTLEVDCLQVLSKMMPEFQELKEVQTLMSAQQLALEILSNMCCPDDANESSEDEWEDIGSDSLDEEVEEDVTEDMEMSAEKLSGEIANAILTLSLPDKVLGKTAFADNTIYEALEGKQEDGKKTIKSVNMVQIRALICLNNIVSSFDTSQLGGSDALGHLWNTLFPLAFGMTSKHFADAQEEFLEAATGVLRAVLEKLTETSKTEAITAEQVSLICQSASSTGACDAVRVKLISMLGFVGKMAATQDSSLDVLKTLGVVLRDVITGNNSLWVIAESLDAIFDSFADGPLVNVAMETVGLLGALQQLKPVLKGRVKAEKRQLGDHFPVVDAARINLTRFLKYKSKVH